ncbi:MAG: hypothetical protein HQL22_08445 [Candidatus Omnitrophica bacterium]|nr:hypothetical protein [Candidatus Omnitrophota bacterium]
MAQSFKIKFDPVSSGSGYIHIEAYDQKAGISTSNFFDPHFDLIHWIEGIVDGKEESLIEIDEEGHIKIMIVNQKPNDPLVHLVVKDYDFPEEADSKEYISAFIEKDVLIRDFLTNFEAFLKTGLRSKEWYSYGEKEPDLISPLKAVEAKYIKLRA